MNRIIILALLAFSPAALAQIPPTVSRPLNGPGKDVQVFALNAGEFLHFQVLPGELPIQVTVGDPAGVIFPVRDCPYDRKGLFEYALVAKSSGQYRIEAALEKPSAGASSWTLRVLESRPAVAGDLELAAAVLQFNQADALRLRRTPESRREAIEKFQAAALVFAKAERRYLEATSFFLSGVVMADSANFRGALTVMEKSTAMMARLGDKVGEGQSWNYVGGMYDVLGEPRKALEAYRQALPLMRDAVQQARILSNMGKVEGNLTHWQVALGNYQQALELIRGRGEDALEGSTLHNLASAYATLGDYDQAIPLYEQAVLLRRKAGDKRGEAITLTSLGYTHAMRNEQQKALEYYSQALPPKLNAGDARGESTTRSYMGLAYAGLGQKEASRESLARALELAQKSGDRRGEAMVRLHTGRAELFAAQAEIARKSAELALAAFRAIGDRDSEAKSLEVLARAAEASGDLAEARRRTEEGIAAAEGNRMQTANQQLRATYFATRQQTYKFYIDLLMRQGEKAKALEVSEQARARSLLEMLAEGGVNIREGADAALIERERNLASDLAAKAARTRTPALDAEIQTLERQVQEVQAEIRRSSPRYAALTQPRPLGVVQMQALLGDGETLLLEYSLGETRSYLWVLRQNSLESFELPGRDRIEAQVVLLTDAILQRKDGAVATAVEALRGMILPPGAGLVKQRLAIVADGALQRLPFSALLVDKHETVVLPSASALAVLRSEHQGRPTHSRQLAIFADPVFEAPIPGSPKATANESRILDHNPAGALVTERRARIPQLPFTRQEAEEILRIAPGASNLRALGYQAKRSAATDSQLLAFRYLHFATHGYLDAERPGLSAIVLSMVNEQGQQQDGFLRVNDIYNLKLSADLVVLSACQTGLGKEVQGEGLMGLSRAFMYAGAPRVIVSLWNVNDRATATLMADLYRRMLRSDKRPSAALREAQLELRKNPRWRSPYYWAAFSQHGDWN